MLSPKPEKSQDQTQNRLVLCVLCVSGAKNVRNFHSFFKLMTKLSTNVHPQ